MVVVVKGGDAGRDWGGGRRLGKTGKERKGHVR